MKTTVCLIAKNEERYFIEWLAYYRLLGFDKIIVYDNRSDISFRNMLRKFACAKLIEHRIWDKGILEAPQISAYRHALKHEKNDWLLFADTDEFLFLRDNINIQEFIAPFHNDPDIGMICLNWRMFGDSSLVEFDDRPVIERFLNCAEDEFPANFHVKSLHRLSLNCPPVHMHACGTLGRMVHASGKELVMSEKWGVAQKIEFENAWINHYYTKSKAEYIAKMQRGQVACRDQHKAKFFYNLDIFNANNRNEVQETEILKILPRLKEEIARLVRLSSGT